MEHMALGNEDEVKYLGKKSSVNRLTLLLIVLVLVFLIIAIVFIALFVVEKNRPAPTEPLPSMKHPHVCGSKECLNTAIDVMKQLNQSVDPCTDFYQFACGGWEKEHALKEGETQKTGFSLLSEKNNDVLKKALEGVSQNYSDNEAVMKTAKFYASCINITAVNARADGPLKKLIDDYGGWNVTGNMTDLNTLSILARVAKVTRDLSVKPLFHVYVATDPHDSSSHILQMGSPEIGMNADYYITNNTNNRKIRDAYLTFMKAIARKLGGGPETERQMTEVFEFESKLARLETSTNAGVFIETLRKAVESGQLLSDLRVTLNHFSTSTGNKLENITDFLELLFKEQGFKFTGDQKIVALPLNYFTHLFDLFRNQSAENPTVIVNYIMWTVIRSFLMALPEDYLKIYNDFRTAKYGNFTTERWEGCIRQMQTYMSMPMGLLFVDSAFDEGSKSAVEDMSHFVRDAFLDNLELNSWMSDATKAQARQKALAIKEDIGYPTFIKDKDKLAAMYKDVTYGDQLFENVLAAVKFQAQSSFKSFRKPVDKDQWFMSPSHVNGYYSPRQNRIVFLAGILQPPFYNKKFPNYLNYGGIGMVVGHEITHGFDGTGRLFDKDGNFRNWWSGMSTLGFQYRSRCLAQQYSKYTVFGKKINGDLTVNENIADNGGLKIAYQAYQRWVKKNKPEGVLPGLELTVDQLFYVGFARPWCSIYTKEPAYAQLLSDSHAFPMYRIIGTLHNDPKFAKVFNCKPNAKMNPAHKCSLW